MLHPSQYFTEAQVKATEKVIHAFLARQKASESQPSQPRAPRVCKTAKEMRIYSDEFFARTNWPEKLSEATAREHELEQQEARYVELASNPPSDLIPSERLSLLQTINGFDSASDSTRHLDQPTMIHRDGILDQIRAELLELRKRMPTLVRAAQAYLDELKHVPTENQIFAARRRESRVTDLLRR